MPKIPGIHEVYGPQKGKPYGMCTVCRVLNLQLTCTSSVLFKNNLTKDGLPRKAESIQMITIIAIHNSS